MKIAYLLLANNQPLHLSRLINRLNHTGTRFFVHVDKSSDLREFANYLHGSSATLIRPRLSSPWGGLGIVKATLSGIKAIIRSGFDYDYIVLISGNDYPIKPNKFISEFLSANNQSSNYIYCHVMNPGIDHEEFRRIQKYFVRVGSNLIIYPGQNASITLAEKLTQRFCKLLFGNYPRQFIPGVVPVFGSQWWALNNKAIKFIATYLDDNPEFLKYFRYSFVPDEMFFQTILYGTGNEEIMQTIVAESHDSRLTFTHWDRPDELYGQALTLNDFSSLKDSTKLFARKFDELKSRDLLNLIDSEILIL